MPTTTQSIIKTQEQSACVDRNPGCYQLKNLCNYPQINDLINDECAATCGRCTSSIDSSTVQSKSPNDESDSILSTTSSSSVKPMGSHQKSHESTKLNGGVDASPKPQVQSIDELFNLVNRASSASTQSSTIPNESILPNILPTTTFNQLDNFLLTSSSTAHPSTTSVIDKQSTSTSTVPQFPQLTTVTIASTMLSGDASSSLNNIGWVHFVVGVQPILNLCITHLLTELYFRRKHTNYFEYRQLLHRSSARLCELNSFMQ